MSQAPAPALLTREQILATRANTLVAIEMLRQAKQAIPEEAAEMLALMDTALHWMDVAQKEPGQCSSQGCAAPKESGYSTCEFHTRQTALEGGRR